MSEITADLTLNTKILLRRAEFDDACILAQGEPGYHTTAKVFKIGDGSTAWKDLPFANKGEIEEILKGYATDAELAGVAEDLEEFKDVYNEFKLAYDAYVAAHAMTDEAINSAISTVSTQVTNTITPAIAANADAIAEIVDTEDGILAQAKSYVDTQDVFHTDIKTVNSLGGIAANATLDGMTTHEILNALLFPYVAFTLGSTSRNAAAATLENGATQTLNSASISITKKSKPIISVKLLNGSTVLGEKTGDEVAAGGTFTFSNLGITVSKSNNPNLKFTVSDGTTSTDKNVGASTFVYPYYWGVAAADATIDETLVEGLTKKVESKNNKTVTYTCANERMVFAYPKVSGYTALKSILDPNNFEIIDGFTCHEVSVTGLDGTAVTYYVYVSTAGTSTDFKVQFKY